MDHQRTRARPGLLALLGSAITLLCAALVAAGCGDDELIEDAVPVSGTPLSTPSTSTTTDPTTTDPTTTPTDEGDLTARAVPWHDGGRGAESPAEAVEEFLDFFGFEGPVDLEGLPTTDATEARVEIRPGVDGDEVDADALPPDDLWSPTHVSMERAADSGWVVTGADSPAVVIDAPADGQEVAPPLDVRVTNRLTGDPLALSVYTGAAVVVERQRVDSGNGVFSAGSFDVVLRWPAEARGPAVLVAEGMSMWQIPAITTVPIELGDVTGPDPRPEPATVLGPVGDQRVDIEYQRGVRLTVHEPGPCQGPSRPVVVTGGPASNVFVDGFVQRGYVVVDVAWRTPGYDSAFSAESLRAVSFAVNDMGVAVRWLRAHVDELCLDTERIVAMGFSFGGITSLALAYSVGEVGTGGVVTVDPLGPPAELRGPPPGPPPELQPYSDTPDAVVSYGGFALGDTIDAGEPPAMVVHGRNDASVPFALAEQTCTSARAVGVTCGLIAHDAGHGIPEETFDDVDQFIRSVLS